MGVCQTVGGAATSGQGMTGDQVAFAIQEGIAIKGDKEKESGTSSSSTATSNGDAGVGKPTQPPPEAYQEVKTVSLKYTSTQEPKEGEAPEGELTIDVTSYAPQVFRYLRQLEGTSDTQCSDEWDLPEEQCSMDLGSGKSMALFIKSKNLDFMAKTIAETEVNVLMDVLQKYTEHLTTNPNSLLMRFTMLYKVEIKSKDITGFILCFGDLFSTCPRLNELWDIKGRVPKPGKYLHFPKHKSSSHYHEGGDCDGPTFDEANAAEDKKEEKEKDGGAKPKHVRTSSIADHDVGRDDNAVAEPQSPTSKKLAVRKDKDLSRLFWVPETKRKALVSQLHADYKILADNGLMDYSILIGVKYNIPGEEKESSAFGAPETAGGSAEAGGEGIPPVSPTLRRRKLLGEAPGGEQQVRPSKGRGSAAQHTSRCQYHDGINSVGGQETYFIGVIDMLTIYNVKKKSANFFKTFLWAPETISTIPPKDYVDRIDKFTDLIFPPLVPDKKE